MLRKCAFKIRPGAIQDIPNDSFLGNSLHVLFVCNLSLTAAVCSQEMRESERERERDEEGERQGWSERERERESDPERDTERERRILNSIFHFARGKKKRNKTLKLKYVFGVEGAVIGFVVLRSDAMFTHDANRATL